MIKKYKIIFAIFLFIYFLSIVSLLLISIKISNIKRTGIKESENLGKIADLSVEYEKNNNNEAKEEMIRLIKNDPTYSKYYNESVDIHIILNKINTVFSRKQAQNWKELNHYINLRLISIVIFIIAGLANILFFLSRVRKK